MPTTACAASRATLRGLMALSRQHPRPMPSSRGSQQLRSLSSVSQHHKSTIGRISWLPSLPKSLIPQSRPMSGVPDRFSRPGPIPLGDKEAQREMDSLIEERNPSIQLMAPSGERGEREQELGTLETHSDEVVEAAESEVEDERHPDTEKEPLQPFADDTNPYTGEKGGPKGPEPTRYGDWERKGRVIDF
ncbi:DUF1674-domain-containing protein [Gonapodya prolifera JEL478]|uniref:Succinate dehydrogenase assembly factor 4, mitochondrial n=1 Tax=Gonapodya prolifera (strain JEL478) TaxID=1344416 RepID=A0A139APL3_GONPJ|nr:DUF1674-domain-containing protein [Gonapodya prolifera JEL478]|eukprot:KXS18697.1 DUF1674-domain-containing protein [Gonapodya prolifera JEL478]